MHGFMALDKRRGLTSAQAVALVRRIVPASRRAGHAGTLDPLATGVLVVALGSATRFIPFLPAQKQYEVECELGVQTATWDSEGEVVARTAVPPNYSAALPKALAELTGDVMQQAPAYSALKYQGKPLYRYARAGIAVPAKVRKVRISAIAVVADDGCGRLKLKVQCGSGVYVRSLVADLGGKFGCGATMTGLVRSSCCGLSLANCVSCDADQGAMCAAVRPCDALLGEIPKAVLDDQQAAQLCDGLSVTVPGAQGLMRVYSGAGRFLGMGCGSDGRLLAKRLLPREA